MVFQMSKLVRMLKIYLMAVSISACAYLPPFPDWNPVLIIPSKNKAFDCKLVDKENLVFYCERQSHPMSSADLDGSFATSASEQKQLINWAKDAKKVIQERCGNGN